MLNIKLKINITKERLKKETSLLLELIEWGFMERSPYSNMLREHCYLKRKINF